MVEHAPKLRKLEIRCHRCKAWTPVDAELGEIVFFKVTNEKIKCTGCGDWRSFSSTSTRTRYAEPEE